MGCGKVLLCVIFPPLAVLDQGCGTVVIVTLLTIFGWLPGALAALFVCLNPSHRVVEVIQTPPKKGWLQRF